MRLCETRRGKIRDKERATGKRSERDLVCIREAVGGDGVDLVLNAGLLLCEGAFPGALFEVSFFDRGGGAKRREESERNGQSLEQHLCWWRKRETKVRSENETVGAEENTRDGERTNAIKTIQSVG